MAYLTFQSKYDKAPETKVPGYDDQAWAGWDEICRRLESIAENRLTLECYPGVCDAEALPRIQAAYRPDLTVNMEDIFFDGDRLTELMQDYLTEDRVRGVMYFGTVQRFLDPGRLEAARRLAREHPGKVLIYGFGASLVYDKSILVYADLTRWEIQLRYRRGMPNYKQDNGREDFLRKYKRGFFVEWRMADRLKRGLFDRMDYYLDTNSPGKPAMVTGNAFRAALCLLTQRPFRLAPYFDPGVWGGQWMKEVCRLDPEEKNYAWAFDGVPEENSLLFRFGKARVESPAMNLTLYRPRELLGKKNYARFGAEFPIRFDMLDTMGGQNLSLQVHPLTDYIYQKFGMPYTQDESYYILDAGEGGGVFLGLKENIDPERMFSDLEKAQEGGKPFEAEKYVNFFPARKHDHFLIPAGTVHCSSANCMVLEVSATPYIFTFKLWDWDRLGLDGRPRPIHLKDGKNVIQLDRTTAWVKENLVNRFQVIKSGPDCTVTRTGLHELEFIETRVFDIRTAADLISDGEVAVANLVEGREAVIESGTGRFAPYTVHYAETFILPADCGDCVIRPARPEEPVKVLVARVRH